MNWTATKTQPWVSLSASSGTAPASLGVSVLTAGMPAGLYMDTVTISAPGALGSPATIAVTMVLGIPGSTGPLAEWTFDTSTITGNTVLDTSGNGINASIVGNPMQGPGVTGQALTFDGSTTYLLTQPTPLPAMTGDLTLAAWIKTTNSSRNETILFKYNSSGSEDGYIFETTAAGYVGVHIGGDNVSGTANQDALDGANRINDGQWHHVAAIMRAGPGHQSLCGWRAELDLLSDDVPRRHQFARSGNRGTRQLMSPICLPVPWMTCAFTLAL